MFEVVARVLFQNLICLKSNFQQQSNHLKSLNTGITSQTSCGSLDIYNLNPCDSEDSQT
jgi:hypothetical protein